MMVQIVTRRNTIVVPALYNPKAYLLNTRAPGYHKLERDVLILECTGANIEATKEVFPDAKWIDEDGTLARRSLQVGEVKPYARQLAPTIQPFAHQSHALDVAMSRSFYGFFHDLGTGKTKTMIDIAFEMFAAGKIDRVLLPTFGKAVPQVIETQLPLHAPKGVRYDAAAVPLGKRKLKEWECPGKTLLIMVCSHDAFASKAQFAQILAFCKAGTAAALVDECFAAGTMISTPKGERKIEELCEGDKVLTSNGVRRITRVFRGRSVRLCRLRLSNGREIICTENHPLFTDVGWLRAGEAEGRELYGYEDVSNLRQGVRGKAMDAGAEELEQRKVLRQILLSEVADDAVRDSKGLYSAPRSAGQAFGSVEGKIQSQVGSISSQSASWAGDTRQDFSDAESEGAHIQRAWRQWPQDGAPGAFADCPARDMGRESRHLIGAEAARLSYLLQDGLGLSERKTGNRDRRAEPQHASGESCRSKEGGQDRRVWVDSAAHFECDGGQDVWNLEIEGCPHYFANGVLVHNSQGFKGWSTERVNNILKLYDVVPYRYLFSGEPEPLGHIDLFSQFYFLNPDIIGHAGITSFRAEYCRMKQYNGVSTSTVESYLKVDKLMEKIAPHCEFIDITDCRDMPKQTFDEWTFKASQQQRDLYARLKAEFIIEVDRAAEEKDREVRRRLCKSAGAKIITMRQVAEGFFYADDPEEERGPITVLNDDRALFSVERMMTAPKGIIWSSFHGGLDSLARAMEKLGVEGVELSGRISPAQFEANKQRFIEDPNCRLIYGTVASGGTALDGLQVAHHMCFHSNSYNWGHRKQAERRIWRVGQEEPCFYADVIGFPVDRKVLSNLAQKRDMGVETRELTALMQLKEEL